MASKDNATRALLGFFQGNEVEKHRLERTLRRADFSVDYGVLAYSLAEMQTAAPPMTTAVQNLLAGKVYEAFDTAYTKYRNDFKANNPIAVLTTIRSGGSLIAPLSKEEYFAKNRGAYLDVLNSAIDVSWAREQKPSGSNQSIGEMFPQAFNATSSVQKTMEYLATSEIPQVLHQIVKNYEDPATGKINWRAVGQNFSDEVNTGWEAAYNSIPNYKPRHLGGGNFSLYFGSQSQKAIEDYRESDALFRGGRTNWSALAGNSEEGDGFDWGAGYDPLTGGITDAAMGEAANDRFSELSIFPDDPQARDQAYNAITNIQGKYWADIAGDTGELNVQTGAINLPETNAWLRGRDASNLAVFGVDPNSPAGQMGMKEGAVIQSFRRILGSDRLATLVDAAYNGVPFQMNFTNPGAQETTGIINPAQIIGRAAGEGRDPNWIENLAGKFDPEVGRSMTTLRGSWKKTGHFYAYTDTTDPEKDVTSLDAHTPIYTGLYTTNEKYKSGMYAVDGGWRLAPLSHKKNAEYSVSVQLDSTSIKAFGEMYEQWNGQWKEDAKGYHKAYNAALKIATERRDRAVEMGQGDKFPALETVVQAEMRKQLPKFGLTEEAASFYTSSDLMVGELRELERSVTGSVADVDTSDYTAGQFDTFTSSQIRNPQDEERNAFAPGDITEDAWKGRGAYQVPVGSTDTTRTIEYTRRPEVRNNPDGSYPGGSGEWILPEGAGIPEQGSVIAGTGHRPNKLGGWGNQKAYNRLVQVAGEQLDKLKPSRVISGAAQGWDQALAEAALARDIPVTMAVPFKGFEERWPKRAQAKLNSILDQVRAQEGGVVKVLNRGRGLSTDPNVDTQEQAARLLQARNEWMINQSDATLAMFDGTRGGTYNAVRYTLTSGKAVKNVYGNFIGQPTRTQIPLDNLECEEVDTSLLGGDPGTWVEGSQPEEDGRMLPAPISVEETNRNNPIPLIRERMAYDEPDQPYDRELIETSDEAQLTASDRAFQQSMTNLADPNDPTANQSAQIGAFGARHGYYTSDGNDQKWKDEFDRLNTLHPENGASYNALSGYDSIGYTDRLKRQGVEELQSNIRTIVGMNRKDMAARVRLGEMPGARRSSRDVLRQASEAYGLNLSWQYGKEAHLYDELETLKKEKPAVYAAIRGSAIAEPAVQGKTARAWMQQLRTVKGFKEAPPPVTPEPARAVPEEPEIPDSDWEYNDDDLPAPPLDDSEVWDNSSGFDWETGNTPADRQAKAAYAYGQAVGDIAKGRERVLYPEGKNTPRPERNLPHFTGNVLQSLQSQFTNSDFEESGFLLGQINDQGGVDVFDVIKPAQKGIISKHRTRTTRAMVEEANRIAQERGGFLAGYIHTHPGDPSQEPQYLRPSNTDVLTRSLAGKGSMNEANWGEDTANVIFNPVSGNMRAWNHAEGAVWDVTNAVSEDSTRPARVGLRRSRKAFAGIEARNSFDNLPPTEAPPALSSAGNSGSGGANGGGRNGGPRDPWNDMAEPPEGPNDWGDFEPPENFEALDPEDIAGGGAQYVRGGTNGAARSSELNGENVSGTPKPLRGNGGFNSPEERERRFMEKRTVIDHPAAYPRYAKRGWMMESEGADGNIRVLEGRMTGAGPAAKAAWMEQDEKGTWHQATNIPKHGTITENHPELGRLLVAHVSREDAEKWESEADQRAAQYTDREARKQAASKGRKVRSPDEMAIEAGRSVTPGEILKLNRREITGTPKRIGETGETYEVEYYDDDNNRQVSVGSDKIADAHGIAQQALTKTFNSSLPSNPAAKVAAVQQRIIDHALEGVEKYVDDQIRSGVSPDLARTNGEKFKQVVLHFTDAVKRAATSTLADEMGVTPGDIKKINTSDVRLKSLDEVNALLGRDPSVKDQLGGKSPEQIWRQGEYFPVTDSGGNVFDIGTQGKYSGGWGGNNMRGGAFGGKWGAIMYAGYMMSREWQMLMGEATQNANIYGKYISQMGMINMPEGVPVGSTDVGYEARQEYAQHYMGKGAYEVMGGFQDIPFLLSAQGTAPARLSTNLGMGAGIAAGGYIAGAGLSMAAASIPALAGMGGIAAALGPVGLAIGGSIIGGSLGMEAYNAIAKPEDPVTWGSLFRGAEQSFLRNKGRNGAINTVFGMDYENRPDTMKGWDWATYSKSRYEYGQNVGDAEIAKQLPWQEAQILMYSGTPDEVEKMENAAGRLTAETGETMENIQAGFYVQKRLTGKVDYNIEPSGFARKVSENAVARGMTSGQLLQEAGEYAALQGFLPGSDNFTEAFKNYGEQEDIGQSELMTYEARSWGQFGSQMQALMPAGNTAFYGRGVQIAKKYGLNNQRRMANYQSMISSAQQFSGQDLNNVQYEMAAAVVSGASNPYVGGMVASAMEQFQLAGGSFDNALQFGQTLSSAGMSNQDASVYARMMGGDLRAYSYQAWQSGNLDNAFFDKAGRSITQYYGSTANQVYNHWAPTVGLSQKTAAQFLGTNNAAILNAWNAPNGNGGFYGIQRLANQQSYAASMAGIGVQMRGIALQENFYWGQNAGGSWDNPTAHSAWGIEDQQVGLQDASTRAGWQDQWTRMTRSNDYAIRREDNQSQRMNTSQNYQNYQWSYSYNQFQQSQVWAQEDWQVQDATRNLQFGWQMDDLNEAIRFASGRERRSLVKQRDRAALTHNLEEEQTDTTRDRQKELWAQQEEQYQKQREYNLELQRLDQDSFQMNKDQREEFYKLDEQSFDRRKKEYEEEKKLQDELRELQRKFQYDQLQLSKEAAGAQAAAAAAQKEINDAILEGQKNWETLTGSIEQMNTYNNAYRIANATNEMMAMMDRVDTNRINKLIELIRTIGTTSTSARWGGERD